MNFDLVYDRTIKIYMIIGDVVLERGQLNQCFLKGRICTKHLFRKTKENFLYLFCNIFSIYLCKSNILVHFDNFYNFSLVKK